ncbi:MAG: hypothetical protein KDB14_02690 [Planctomycetales bacterium]|nr:hypothetical protein [Planctomycetales bacterium]
MPYFFDEENAYAEQELDEDEDFPLPTLDQFEYLPPEVIGGASGPVSFIVSELESGPPTTDDGASDLAQSGSARPSWWLRLLIAPIAGTKLGKYFSRMSSELNEFKSRLEKSAILERRYRRNLFALLVPALRSVGGTHVYCAYDGGNDEGFAYFQHLQVGNEQWKASLTAEALANTNIVKRWQSVPTFAPREGVAPQAHLAELLESVAEVWATMLLGSGFGTGPFQMYGAFTVNLQDCTITDDRDAHPLPHGNLEIADIGDIDDGSSERFGEDSRDQDEEN